MSVPKFFLVVDFVNAFPATTSVGFHEGGEADVVEHALPVQRGGEVGEAFVGSIVRLLVAGQEYGFRDGYAGGAYAQDVVEKLLVSAPPKGVVDDGRSGGGGVLKHGAVEGYVLADAVNNHRVAWVQPLAYLVNLYGFGRDAVDVLVVNALNDGGRKTAFATVEDTYLFHLGVVRLNYVFGLLYASVNFALDVC